MNGNKSFRKSPIQLLLSAVVVVGSVVGAWYVIETSKITEVYLVTNSDLASGTALIEQSLESTELALFSLGSQYLRKGQLPAGAYLTRTISAGEVIPISALTTQQLDDYSNIVLTPSVEISSAITPGAKVAVWASPALDYQSFGEPTIAAVDVEVVQVREPEGSFASAAKSVELRVPLSSVQSILRAIANRDAIALTASSVSVGN